MARTSQPTVEQAQEMNLAWLRDLARQHGLQRVAVDVNVGNIECRASFDAFGTTYGNRIRKFRALNQTLTKTLTKEGWKPGRSNGSGAALLLRSPDRRFEIHMIDHEVSKKRETLTEVGVVLVDRKAR